MSKFKRLVKKAKAVVSKSAKPFMQSVASGGLADMYYASKEKNFAGGLDRVLDPGGVVDTSLRSVGSNLSPGAMTATNVVLKGLGTYYGGVVGSAAAGGIMGKLQNQGDTKVTQGALVSGASALAGEAAEYAGTTASSTVGTVGGDIIKGAVQGGTNAALTGQNVGEGALYGAAGGAIAAGSQPAINYGAKTLAEMGLSNNAANMTASTIYGAGSGAAKSAIQGQDLTQGALTGAATGAASGTGGNTMATDDSQWISGISNDALLSLGFATAAGAYTANENANLKKDAMAATTDALGMQKVAYDQQRELFQPYLLAGNRALAQSTDMARVTGGKDQIINDPQYMAYIAELNKPNAAIYDDPTYRFQLAESNKNTSRNLRALGRENSTYGMDVAAKQANNLAVGTLNDRNSRLSGLASTRYASLTDQYNRLRDLASSGQAAAGMTSAAGQNYANNSASATLANQALAAGQKQNNFNNLTSLASLGIKGYQAYNTPTKPATTLYSGATLDYTPADTSFLNYNPTYDYTADSSYYDY